VVAFCKQQAFDVVLMDLEMPEMDGLEATAEIRRVMADSSTRPPILAMTAHAIPGFRQRCIEAGMDGYITKPIQPAELFDAIDGLLMQVNG
jgi:CheY-like chemotaxis protein